MNNVDVLLEILTMMETLHGKPIIRSFDGYHEAMREGLDAHESFQCWVNDQENVTTLDLSKQIEKLKQVIWKITHDTR